MEPNSVYGYSAGVAQAIPAATHVTAPAAAIYPPASKRVLEQLAGNLTPPHSLVLQPSRAQVRSGAYDNLAAHCLQEAHRPDAAMRWAYDACTEVIRRHSKSFYFSARLLPAAKREGVMALYAYCRLSDDLVDETDDGGTDDGRWTMDDESYYRPSSVVHRQAKPYRPSSIVHRLSSLDSWAKATACVVPKVDHPVIVAWADARNRFGIPQTLADELLEGVRMDLTINRYETWDDLWLYCYRVASTVGLMSMYITGAETMEAVPYAVQLGVALQLTNILRDVGEDARAGRIYLPKEDMDRFGYTEEMLMESVINKQFVNLMRFEIGRAHALYEASWPGVAMLPADSRLAVEAAGTVYRSILNKIESANYDVFNHRAHLSAGEKLRKLPGLWWGVRRLER